jgi:hypothetical protein
MDETGKAEKDEKTSDGEPTSTSDKKGKTFTEQEVTKTISDLKAAHGREQKRLTDQLEAARQDTEATNQRLTELQRRIDEAELDKARDDPALLKLYQERQELQKEKATIEEEKRNLQRDRVQLDADKQAVTEAKKDAMVVNVALKHHLNIKDLADLGITDEEALDKVAARIAAGKPKKAGEEEKELEPDSALGSGEKGTPTMEEQEKMSPAEYIKWRQSQEKTAE